MTNEQAVEIIKLLKSLDSTGWIVIGFLGAIVGLLISILRRD